MKKLLIVADDFGISKGVNKAIFECCELKILTGVSVMTAGAGFKEITELIKFSDVEIGLHFDLFSPNLSTGFKLEYSPAQLARRLYFDKKLLNSIAKELRAQIEKLTKFTQIKHIDSHRHLHYIPQIFKIVNALTEEYAINRIRIPVPKIRRAGLKFIFNRKDFFKFFPFFIWKNFNNTNAASNDDFFGLFQVGALSEEYLNHIFECDFEYAELMVHPGYVDETLEKTDDKLLYYREKELKLLKNYFIQKFREDKFIFHS